MRSTAYWFWITVAIGLILLATGFVTQHWPEITGWLAQHGIHL